MTDTQPIFKSGLVNHYHPKWYETLLKIFIQLKLHYFLKYSIKKILNAIQLVGRVLPGPQLDYECIKFWTTWLSSMSAIKCVSVLNFPAS